MLTLSQAVAELSDDELVHVQNLGLRGAEEFGEDSDTPSIGLRRVFYVLARATEEEQVRRLQGGGHIQN